MSLNFFQHTCQEPARTDIQFGLCDDENGQKAYTDTTNPNKWVALVKNNSAKAIVFTAIDKCVIQDNEQLGRGRCDGMLTSDNLLYLVELKNQEPPWQSDAIRQLESTIQLLLENHDISSYRKRDAFVVIDDEDNLKFYRRTTFRLDIQAEIIII